MPYILADDCVDRDYPAGSAFLDPGNRIHTAINRGQPHPTTARCEAGARREGRACYSAMKRAFGSTLL